ncbi:MAG: endonuclease III [Lachnospiraceae bacterium]|nr:endonuclease III [Lachnospiraceae bacterium]
MTAKERVRESIERLKAEYPDAICSLTYDEAWKLLVAVRLSAQCTDERVNKVTPGLFSKYPGPKALAEAEVSDIEKIVKPCGLGHTKASDIKKCMQVLLSEFDGAVPDEMEKLLRLPGVGRKSANLIMGDVYGKPAIVCDTHVIRLSNRIGFVKDIREPEKLERALKKLVPPEEGNDLCHRMVLHGRKVCTARTTPACENCCLSDICAKRI